MRARAFLGPVSNTRTDRALVALFLLALVVRVGAALRTAAIFNDGPHFLRLSELLGRGEWAAALRDAYHPLYPGLTAAVSLLVEKVEIAAIGVSVVSGSLAVLALYAFVRWAFDDRTAWIAGVLLAIHPYASRFSADVQSEGLYFALFLGAVAGLWRALQHGRAPAAAVAGSLIGLAYLVRPEGLGLAAVALAFALRRIYQGHWTWTAGGRWLAALGLATAIFAGPYILHLRIETGEWMLTQKKSISQLTSRAEDSLPARDAVSPRVPEGARWQPAPGPRDRRHEASLLLASWLQPGQVQRGTESASLRALIELLHTSQSALHLVLVLLIGVGLYQLRGKPGDRGLFLAAIALVYAVAAFGLVRNVGYLDRRHVLVPLIPLFGYAATGVQVLARKALTPFTNGPATARHQLQATWLCLAVVAALVLPKTLAPHRDERLATRRAAEWLAEQPHLVGPVAAEKQRTAWYAGAEFVQLPRADAKLHAAQLQGRGARFLIVDAAKFARRGWLQVPASLQLRELWRVEAAGRTAYVYELSGPQP